MHLVGLIVFILHVDYAPDHLHVLLSKGELQVVLQQDVDSLDEGLIAYLVEVDVDNGV